MSQLTTILVVDDEPGIRKLLEAVLSKFGYGVLPAANGAEAVEIYRQHGETVALALLDVQMPGGMDGPQTLAALRNLNPELPCCFMSGSTGLYSAGDLLSMGAAHLFNKPFGDWREFVSVLSDVACRARNRRYTA